MIDAWGLKAISSDDFLIRQPPGLQIELLFQFSASGIILIIK